MLFVCVSDGSEGQNNTFIPRRPHPAQEMTTGNNELGNAKKNEKKLEIKFGGKYDFFPPVVLFI